MERSHRMARRAAIIGAGVVALAGGCLAASAAAAPDGFAYVRAPFEVTAGKPFSIRAQVDSYDRARRARTCRLLLTGPRGARVGAPKRTVHGDASIGWRITIPLASNPGQWKTRLACDRARTAWGGFTLKPATRPLVVVGAQLTPELGSTSGYFWAARISNPFPSWQLGSVVITASFRDAAGRLVGTDKTYEFEGPTMSAGTAGWVGGETYISGETPTSVSVSAIGSVLPRSGWQSFSPIDVRTVYIPAYDGGPVDLRVRGEAENPNAASVSAAVFVTLFDAAGRLISASKDRSATVGQGVRVPVDVSMGRLGTSPPARLEFFAPPIVR